MGTIYKQQDSIRIGELFTERYIEYYGFNKSLSLGKLYSFKYRSDLKHNSENVKSIGEDDVSDVFELVPLNEPLDVNVQDRNTRRLSIYLARTLSEATLVSDLAKDLESFNITTSIAPVVNDFICLQENRAITQTEIKSVVSLGGDEYTVSLAVPLDHNYTTASHVVIQSADMNINSTNGIYEFEAKPYNSEWDITRMIISMTHDSKGDDGTFGDLNPLDTSQYFRKENGDTSQNLMSIRENSDFRIEGYDIAYPERSGGKGSYGTTARISFNGDDKNGVVISLNSSSNDRFVSVIRDEDLSSLERYRIKVQGHVVKP